MIHRALRVYGWTVDFLFAVKQNDEEGVLGCLYDYGATKRVIEDVLDIMDPALVDCGFTFSNSDRRVCLSWIGPQSAGAQYINTTVHEIVHVAMAVAREAGINPLSETFAYLVGDITQEVSDILCELGCDHCREGGLRD